MDLPVCSISCLWNIRATPQRPTLFMKGQMNFWGNVKSDSSSPPPLPPPCRPHTFRKMTHLPTIDRESEQNYTYLANYPLTITSIAQLCSHGGSTSWLKKKEKKKYTNLSKTPWQLFFQHITFASLLQDLSRHQNSHSNKIPSLENLPSSLAVLKSFSLLHHPLGYPGQWEKIARLWVCCSVLHEDADEG